MPSKTLPNTHLRLTIAHRFLTMFDIYVLTVVDSLFFLYYALQRNVLKHQHKVEIKRAHNIKKGNSKTDYVNETLKNIIKEIEYHHKAVPFIIRFIPSIVLGAIIWLT